MTNPTRVVYGTRQAMIAEYSVIDPCSIGIPANECRFIVLPLGDGQWDAEWFRTIKHARGDAYAIADAYSIPVETI
jgi:hypothetical protein